ncbi:MAG TPA: methyltransferase domain-containing protein [Anaerolineales bacterium]|nr:methyltransferase domain-containing protein [Anaerolineales bacterium]
MDCCKHNQGLNNTFNESTATGELKAYWKKGIDQHARRVVEMVSARGIERASILEVGAGLGGLHLELLKRGAASATDMDVSAAYVAAAQGVAEKLGLRDRIEYRVGDFAGEADSVSPADVVVMHRVVCCYPDMPQLVTAAAGHAKRLMALTVPRGTWYMQLGQQVINFGMWLTRAGFRFYVHDPEAIMRVAARAGLRMTQSKFSGVWQIMVFERG